MKFNTSFSRDRSTTEPVGSELITRPDKALSIRDILIKYTRGESFDVPSGSFGGYDGEYGDDEDMDFDDPVDYLNTLGLDLADAYQISLAFDQVIDSGRESQVASSPPDPSPTFDLESLPDSSSPDDEKP